MAISITLVWVWLFFPPMDCECSIRQRWLTLVACGQMQLTDWIELRVCLRRGWVSTDFSWAGDSSLWLKVSWKHVNPPETCAMVRYTLRCELPKSSRLEILLHCNFHSVPINLQHFAVHRLELIFLFAQENYGMSIYLETPPCDYHI